MRAVRAAMAGALVPLVACAAAIDWNALRGTGSSDASTSDAGEAGGSSGGGDAHQEGSDGSSPVPDGAADARGDSTTDTGNGGTDSGATDGSSEAEAAPPLSYEQTVLADHPIAYFRFEDDVGSTTAADDVNGGPGGAVSSTGVTFQSQSLLGSEPSSHSAYFDASQGGSVTVGGADDTQLQFHANAPFSLELWMLAEYTDAAPNYSRIVSDEVNPAQPTWAGYYLDTPPSGQQGIFLTMEENDVACGSTYGSALPAGQAVYIVATFDGTKTILYVNGTGYGTSACAPDMTQTNTPFSIGGSSVGGPYYWGYLDEVAVYGEALSAARVTAHYQAGK